MFYELGKFHFFHSEAAGLVHEYHVRAITDALFVVLHKIDRTHKVTAEFHGESYFLKQGNEALSHRGGAHGYHTERNALTVV